MRSWWIVLSVLGACGDDGGDAAPADSALGDVATADAAPDGPTCPAKVVYLNRTGGTFTHGTNDNSSTNVSVVIEQAASPKTLAAPTISAADWTAVRACLDNRFAPFRIAFTETDPGSAEHVELVIVAGTGDLNLPGGTLRLASSLPCDLVTNAPVPSLRAISYTVWGAYENTLRCENLAAALATSYGLDSAFSCPDITSQLNGCGAKSFTDADVTCGEFSARACRCGGNTQNSFQYLKNFLGTPCP